jgi:hypothetical protein
MKEADFGVIVLARSQGDEELRAQGLGAGFSAEDARPGNTVQLTGSTVWYWLVVEVVSPLPVKQRFFARSPASFHAYASCASGIAEDVRAWAEQNAAALVAARTREAGSSPQP